MLTNSPNGVSSFGIPQILAGLPVVPNKDGSVFFVDPLYGNDSNDGLSPDTAYATLSTAHSACSAGRNDIVFFLSAGSSTANTTDYQSEALTWSKDKTHLIGLTAPCTYAQRARIAQLSTATDVDGLLTISADACIFANIHVFHGVDDATSKGAVKVTGERNYFANCHFAGIGHASQDTAANYSLNLAGGSENTFENCVIGLDTIARGTAANSELLFTSSATRNTFRDCIFPTFAEADTHQFLIAAATSVDRTTLFENCAFINAVGSTATAMTEAFDINASAGGLFLLRNCTVVGADDWEANTESGLVYIDGAAPTNNTSGIAVNVEAT